mmetsp:Transcript_3927/g.8974  ORF Transcript_3927/g.8974 Transcript_3927/m.8974 type:complete len:100 (+) Transcript_3927:60-359(+)
MGLKPYFRATREILSQEFPEAYVTKEIISAKSTRDEGLFEILIDGYSIYQKKKKKKAVYLEMETLKQMIERAKRRRRPSSVVASRRRLVNLNDDDWHEQ